MAHRSLALLALCALAFPLPASANGRPPATSSIHFKVGTDNEIIAGVTFGLLVSTDSGATWQWYCEDAVGYGGIYDPDYVHAADAVFATTFDGVLAERDSCSFAPTGLGMKFADLVERGPDGALYVATADPADARVHKSTDGGGTFGTAALPPGALVNDWYESLEVAPSDANRVYLTGFRLAAGQPKRQLLYRSDDGGITYQALPNDSFAVMPNSSIEIVGVSHADANTVYARVNLSDNSLASTVYRSTDGGTTWSQVLEKRSSLSFLVRGNGDLVAATQLVDPANGLGAFVSKDGGATWIPLPSPPHINCLAESAAGEVWACTQNYGSPGIESDGFGIMKSSGELESWTGILKYQDIQAPVSCPSGTTQKDKCDQLLWCGLCQQLGCNAGRDCPAPGESDGPPDAPAPPLVAAKDGGCCGSAPLGSNWLLVGVVVGLLSVRRTRVRPVRFTRIRTPSRPTERAKD